MKLVFDLHTHTIASGHAYSTLKENVEEAKKKGLQALGMSDHASSVPGAPTYNYFKNFEAIPLMIQGIHILTGVEANIIDYQGSLDMEEELLKKVDYVIASTHRVCLEWGSVEENTAAYIGAMKNPYVKIIGHPDDIRYPVDYEQLVQAAATEKVALEVNSGSFSPRTGRQGAQTTLPEMLKYCKEYKVPIIVSSDAHMFDAVGEFTDALRLLEEIKFPEELVLNTSLDGLNYVLNGSRRLADSAWGKE